MSSSMHWGGVLLKVAENFSTQRGPGLSHSERQGIGTPWWSAGGPFSSEESLSMHSSSILGGLQGSFQETGLQSTQEGPQTEKHPMTSRTLFKKL